MVKDEKRGNNMNDNYLIKLKDILNDTLHDITEKSDTQVKSFFEEHGISYDEYYAFFLKYHGNDYVNDDYWFCYKDTEGNVKEFMVDMLFGLQECTGNIIEEIKSWEHIIPENLVPIADRPGGNLVCMDKKDGKIYFWFHDKIDNLMLVSDSFESFINEFHVSE